MVKGGFIAEGLEPASPQIYQILDVPSQTMEPNSLPKRYTHRDKERRLVTQLENQPRRNTPKTGKKREHEGKVKREKTGGKREHRYTANCGAALQSCTKRNKTGSETGTKLLQITGRNGRKTGELGAPAAPTSSQARRSATARTGCESCPNTPARRCQSASGSHRSGTNGPPRRSATTSALRRR